MSFVCRSEVKTISNEKKKLQTEKKKQNASDFTSSWWDSVVYFHCKSSKF